MCDYYVLHVISVINFFLKNLEKIPDLKKLENILSLHIIT